MSRPSGAVIGRAIGVVTAAVAVVLIVVAAAADNHALVTWLGVPLMLGVVAARWARPRTRPRGTNADQRPS